MQNEVKLLTSVCVNKDMSSVITAPEIDELFSAYPDVWKTVKDYFYKHRQTPSLSRVYEWYPDFDKADVEGPTRYYLDQLRQEKILEGLQEIALGIAEDIENGSDAHAVFDLYQKKISRLNKFNAGARDLNIVDIDNAMDHYEKMSELADRMGGSIGIPTSFAAIDSAYHTGMAAGHFICIIGWPGHKKSFVSEELAIRSWIQGFKPMIVSLEMTPENMRDRLYTLMAQGNFKMSELSRGTVDQAGFQKWADEQLADKHPFVIVTNEGASEISCNMIQAKIDQHQPDILIVDYLQLLSDNAKSGNEVQKIRNISKELKRLAMVNNIPVVAIISATSQEKKDRTVPPMLDQAGWSKSIEYDADLAFAVHTYKSEDDEITEIVCRKNRHGSDFAFYLKIDPENGIIEEKYDPPGWLDA